MWNKDYTNSLEWEKKGKDICRMRFKMKSLDAGNLGLSVGPNTAKYILLNMIADAASFR